MDDEAEIGLVESHPQRRRRHQSLDPVGEQVGFELFALSRVRRAGVGGDVMAQVFEQRGQVAGAGDGQRVDDAGAFQ